MSPMFKLGVSEAMAGRAWAKRLSNAFAKAGVKPGKVTDKATAVVVREQLKRPVYGRFFGRPGFSEQATWNLKKGGWR